MCKWDYSKQKTSAWQGNNEQRWRNNLQNLRKYLQSVHLTRGSYPENISNSNNSAAKKFPN